MKIFCGPKAMAPPAGIDLQLVLYGQPDRDANRSKLVGSAGAATEHAIRRLKYAPSPEAWDFLSLALAVVGSDLSFRRGDSPDGWTRQIDLTVAVGDAEMWEAQAAQVEEALRFLSTDIWKIRFIPGGYRPLPPDELFRPIEDSVSLLSGGMDSLIGAIDLVAAGHRPIAVSNTVRGDAANQQRFAERVGLTHLPLNHNASPPWAKESSQRARSLIFIAFGVLAATSLQAYQDAPSVPLFMCENGFIALNPPLTGTRLGSLSTRTAHPQFLNGVRSLLDATGIRVSLMNPYQHMTKGEMLRECADQQLLAELAASSVSCGRYLRFNYKQCGRCVPCQVRRASYLAWSGEDPTQYVFPNLGRRDNDNANFDDVRSVAMAITQIERDGLESWLGSSLSYPNMGPRAPLKSVIERGMSELAALHRSTGVL